MKPLNLSSSLPLRAVAIAAALGLSLSAAGCAPGVSDPQDKAQEEQSANQPISNAVGKATPQDSPAASAPSGELIELGAEFHAVSDLAAVGDIIAVRSGHKLTVGTVDELKNHTSTTLLINQDCGDLSAAAGSFILACPNSLSGGAGGGEIAIINPDKPGLENHRTAPMKFTAATLTTDGVLIGGSADENDLYAFRGQDSAGAKKIQTGRKTHQLVSSPVEGSRDAVVFIDRDTTAIQGVDYANNRQGAALRMGVGVGTIAAGENGLIFAADTLGHQFGLYTDTDVLRLHQTLPTGQAPWALAADPKRDAVWVATNGDNFLQAFTYNTGVPVGHGKINTPAKVRAVAVLNDGSLITASQDSSALHLVSNEAVNVAVDKQ